MLLWEALLVASAMVAQPSAPAVVTPLDYFDHGRRQVDSFLHRFSTLRATANDAADRCARVEVRYGFDENAFRSVLGSGVLLGDGRHLLTAGHVVDGFDEGEIHVSFPTGETLTATLVNHRYAAFEDRNADWAILRLHGRVPRVGALRTSTLAAGDVALLFGYPSHIGIDADGEIVFGESDTRYLEPIVTVGKNTPSEPWILDPHVGAVPTEGMSGGPVFDTQGRLVGILVSVLRESGAESLYHYRMVPVTGIPDLFKVAGTTPAGSRTAPSHSAR